MSEAKERALYLHNLFEQQIEDANKAAANAKRLNEEAQERYDALRYDRIRLKEAYNNFKIGVKDVCLQYVIEALMSSALHRTIGDKDQNMVHGLVHNYITESGGASAILNRITNKTYLIDCIKEEVEETTEEIIAKADPEDPETFQIDKEDLSKLVDKLAQNDDFEEVKSAIAIRVVGAEDSFVDNCKAEKEKLDDIITNVEDKCKAVDADEKISDEAKEAIKQEAMREATRQRVALSERPKKNVFDEMVRLFTNNCIKNKIPGYINESTGKPDTERVVRTVTTIYTLIEALSSSKLENVNEAFIEKSLKELTM